MSWIKLEHTTPDKPEVWEMAEILSLDPDAVLGKLLRAWIWADQNCNASGVTSVTVLALLDRMTGVTGFGNAMVSVGWIIIDGRECIFTNFDRHNGKPAKTRALGTKRMAAHRGKCNAPSVTNVTHDALPEKIREEYTNNAREAMDGLPCIDGYPTQAQAIAAGGNMGIQEEIAARWWLDRDGEGWQNRNGHPAPLNGWHSNLKSYAEKWRANEQRNRGGKSNEGSNRGGIDRNAGTHNKASDYQLSADD